MYHGSLNLTGTELDLQRFHPSRENKNIVSVINQLKTSHQLKMKKTGGRLVIFNNYMWLHVISLMFIFMTMWDIMNKAGCGKLQSIKGSSILKSLSEHLKNLMCHCLDVQFYLNVITILDFFSSLKWAQVWSLFYCS